MGRATQIPSMFRMHPLKHLGLILAGAAAAGASTKAYQKAKGIPTKSSRAKKDLMLNAGMGATVGSISPLVPSAIRKIRSLPLKARKGLGALGLLAAVPFAGGYALAGMGSSGKSGLAKLSSRQEAIGNLFRAGSGAMVGASMLPLVMLARERNKKRKYDKDIMSGKIRPLAALGALAGGYLGWKTGPAIKAIKAGLGGPKGNAIRAALLSGTALGSFGLGYGLKKFIGKREK